jgi:hypothetical protein
MWNAIRRSHLPHSGCGYENGDFEDDHEITIAIEKVGPTRCYSIQLVETSTLHLDSFVL